MLSERVYRAAHESAAVIDADWLGTISVRGPDSVTWLNSLVTCDVRAVRPGLVAYGLALMKNGRILSDLWIAQAKDRLLLGAPRDRVSALSEHFERYLIMEDAAHEDVSVDYGWVFALGPHAPEMVNARVNSFGVSGGRTSVTTVRDAALVAPVSSKERILASFSDEPGVAVGSLEDHAALMLDLFVPRFGVDFGEKNYPQEAGLEKTAVSFTKGCYLGQEVVCRLEMRGHVSKRMLPIQLEGDVIPSPGAEVRDADGATTLGIVSSAGMSQRLGTPLALAMIKGAHPGVGAKVRVGDGQGTVLDPNQVQSPR